MVHGTPPVKWLVVCSHNHYEPTGKCFPWAFYMIIKDVIVDLSHEDCILHFECVTI
jgi:hypothetical protein